MDKVLCIMKYNNNNNNNTKIFKTVQKTNILGH
jgi:hypothetical protein